MREQMQEIAKFALESGVSLQEFRNLATESMICVAVSGYRNQSKAARMLGLHRNTLGKIYRSRRTREML